MGDIKACDNFCNNDTDPPHDMVVTYEIQNSGSENMYIDDGEGNTLTKNPIPPGKTKDHIFTVKPGKKLHCEVGSGKATLKAQTIAASLRVERSGALATKVAKARRPISRR